VWRQISSHCRYIYLLQALQCIVVRTQCIHTQVAYMAYIIGMANRT
jgi:hypothetical protein